MAGEGWRSTSFVLRRIREEEGYSNSKVTFNLVPARWIHSSELSEQFLHADQPAVSQVREAYGGRGSVKDHYHPEIQILL